MAIEIVSCPIKNGDFHSYVSLPEGKTFIKPTVIGVTRANPGTTAWRPIQKTCPTHQWPKGPLGTPLAGCGAHAGVPLSRTKQW